MVVIMLLTGLLLDFYLLSTDKYKYIAGQSVSYDDDDSLMKMITNIMISMMVNMMTNMMINMMISMMVNMVNDHWSS